MMNEKTIHRVPSTGNETSQPQMASVVDEKKRKVVVIGEEHGLDELQGDITASTVVDEEENLLTAEKIKEFFEATEEGSIERLDELFDKTPHSDPNMTRFTESLLMAAIRAKQQKVAEYLIDQLAINTDHKIELLEFNTCARIPIRERKISSRDLAYDEGMMNLVDLIDIASKEIKPCTKRFLQRRMQTSLDEIHQAYLKRMEQRKIHLIKHTVLKESEEVPTIDVKDNIELPLLTTSPPSPSRETPPPPPPPPPPVLDRSCKSYIEETLHSIQSSNEKSIDETGKKYFRFSGYTVRYRIVDAINPNQQIKRQTHAKKTRLSFPTILPQTNSQLSPSTLSTSRTLPTTSNLNSRSFNNMNTQVPIRETRTSICRSALHRKTPRLLTTNNSESNSEIKPTCIHEYNSSI
ncbi:hypothetical protein I4U23_009209 [Adineta vaga]|nr:hypothetical protein I4U23_009209 [Adineta vaga]